MYLYSLVLFSIKILGNKRVVYILIQFLHCSLIFIILYWFVYRYHRKILYQRSEVLLKLGSVFEHNLVWKRVPA